MTKMADALSRLRRGADATRALPPLTFHRTGDGGEPELKLINGRFPKLELTPGTEVTLSAKLDLPQRHAGVSLVGDRLSVVVDSLYPVHLEVDGEHVVDEDIPPVALGPILLDISDSLHTDGIHTLTARVRVPEHQVLPWWVGFNFSTPRLRERFEVLDIAYAQLELASAVASSPEESELIEHAAGLVPDRLDEIETEDLARTLDAIPGALGVLSERASQIPVHVVGHCHIDLKWLWTWSDTTEVIMRDVRNIVAMMDDYPEMRFTHSQPAGYDVVRRLDPGLFDRMRELVASGRWEPATMTWVEGDTNMASGEAHARQLLEGVRYTREMLGVDPSVFLAPDTFGHAGNLPQLARSAGAIAYYHHRANPGGHERWPAYWWEGDDGSRILGISTGSYNGDITASRLAAVAAETWRNGLPCGLHFFGVGDHGGGPSRMSLDALRRLQTKRGLPSARCSTIRAYADEVIVSGAPLPVHRGESSTIFEGCYTTHGDTKRYNRHGENLLCTADTLGALAGLDTRQRLQEPWRTVLFNQFHDILDGSAIHEVYAEHAEDFERVRSSAHAAIDEALDILESGIDPGQVAVTNPTGADQTNIVTVTDLPHEEPVWLKGPGDHLTPGQPTPEGLCFVARVPALETVSYEVVDDQPAPPVLEVQDSYSPLGHLAMGEVLGTRIDEEPPYLLVDTRHFRAFVRRDCGVIVSLVDHRSGRELVGFGMRRASDYADTARPDLGLNVLQLVEEHPHGMTSWHMDEVWRETSLIRGASTSVVETGPVRSTIEVVHQLRSSEIRQRISFYQELPRIDFHTLIDWQEPGNDDVGVPNLKVAFTLRTTDAQSWFETPFGATRRPSDGQEVPALRWASVGGADHAITLLNDSKYGHDAMGGRLRLNLVRSGYHPDEISDIGPHEVRYSLVPHPGTWKNAGIVSQGIGFNQPLIGRVVTDERPSADTWRPTPSSGSVVISCLRTSDDGARLVRLYESQGQTSTHRLGGLGADARVWETNVVEDPIRELEAPGGELSLTFRPWQVRTLLVRTGGSRA